MSPWVMATLIFLLLSIWLSFCPLLNRNICRGVGIVDVKLLIIMLMRKLFTYFVDIAGYSSSVFLRLAASIPHAAEMSCPRDRRKVAFSPLRHSISQNASASSCEGLLNSPPLYV